MNRFAWFQRALTPRLRTLWPNILIVPLALAQYASQIGHTKVAPDETGWMRARAAVALMTDGVADTHRYLVHLLTLRNIAAAVAVPALVVLLLNRIWPTGLVTVRTP